MTRASMRLTGDRVSPCTRVNCGWRMRETLHELARSQSTGHRGSGFPRVESLPHAGCARRARRGAGRVPVRRRCQPGQPGRCPGGTCARRYPRDRSAQRLRGCLGHLQPGRADQPHGRAERSAGRHRSERGGAGAADPGGTRGGAGRGGGACLDAAVLWAGAEAAGGREPGGGAARREWRVEVRRGAVPGCWNIACVAGRWCRCG